MRYKDDHYILANIASIVHALEDDLVGNRHQERLIDIERQLREINIILQTIKGTFKDINIKLRSK